MDERITAGKIMNEKNDFTLDWGNNSEKES